MKPEDLAAAAAHSREAMTAIRHIAQHGLVGGMTYVMTSAEDVPGLLDHIAGQDRMVADQEARLIAQAKRMAELERDEGGTIDERDNNAEWADRLAAAVAEHFGIDVGEHSNTNNPWRTALEAFANTQVSPTRPLTGRCGICLKGVHQPVGEDWSHYAMPVPYHEIDGVTVNEPKPTADPVCTADVHGLACNGIHLTTTPAVPEKETTS